jgi:hypothetical protein
MPILQWSMQHGSSPRSALPARLWICGKPTELAPRSPLDCCFWGFVDVRVYKDIFVNVSPKNLLASIATSSCRQHALSQMCKRFLHACSALCKCANWLCRTCTPHHTVTGRSSVSLTQSPFAFPSNCRCGPPLTSYMPGRSIPCTAQQHTSSAHCSLCTACAPLRYRMQGCQNTTVGD